MVFVFLTGPQCHSVSGFLACICCLAQVETRLKKSLVCGAHVGITCLRAVQSSLNPSLAAEGGWTARELPAVCELANCLQHSTAIQICVKLLCSESATLISHHDRLAEPAPTQQTSLSSRSPASVRCSRRFQGCKN